MLACLAAGLGAVLVDGARSRPPACLADAAAVARLPGPAVGAPWFEPRVRAYADYSTVVHPELEAPAALDFVYEP